LAKCYDPALGEFTREIDAMRRLLNGVDPFGIHPDPVLRERTAAAKAFAYVWLSAAFEQFVRAVLRALLRELTSYQIPISDLQTCLLSLGQFSTFDALRDVGGLTGWSRRVELLSVTRSTDPATFSDAVLPLDGRTLRPEHFDVIWRVFHFAGPSLPSGRHAFAVNDLAEGRNSVAHGHISPISFGRSKVMSDVLRLVEFIEEIVTDVGVAIDTYLNEKSYLI
jgi:hypothetical protein